MAQRSRYAAAISGFDDRVRWRLRQCSTFLTGGTMYVSLRERPEGETRLTTDVPARRVAATVVLLGFVSLLTDVSSEMIAAVLPLYLTAELGLGLLAYGVVDGLYRAPSALVRIGSFGDRPSPNGSRRWAAASAVSRVASRRTGWQSSDRGSGRGPVGRGPRTAPRDAPNRGRSAPESVGRSFGVHRAMDMVGAAIGPLAAPALLLAVPRGYSAVSLCRSRSR
jgi:hypothetical protein